MDVVLRVGPIYHGRPSWRHAAEDYVPKRVLLVQASQTEAVRFQLVLERFGLEVEIVDTGAAALSAVQRRKPDLVILTVNAPVIDGHRLCLALQHTTGTASLPVVILSSRTTIEDSLAALRAGASDSIPNDSFAERNLIESLRQLRIL